MFSLPWPRWMAVRLEKKSRPRQQVERLHVPPSLEWLERRELLTTAAPFFGVPTQSTSTTGEERATPASDVEPLFGSDPPGYSPSQISQAYGFNQISFTNGAATVKGDGSGQTIAIVAAYDDPNITNDLNAFDQYFKLASPSLSVVNQNGGAILPAVDPTGDWEAEEALDVEWAHAMAQGANIVLVEANSDNISDLVTAVKTAAGLPGVSVVSLSWGDSEFKDETNYDSYFTTPAGHSGVTFVAAAGDTGAPPIYPAVSPNVLAVGGTTLQVDSEGNYVGESAWSGSGGGISAYEAQPSYQKSLVTQSLTQRTSPDVAYDASPVSAFAVYDSYSAAGETGPWFDIGGTSAGAPQWAALVAIADQGRALLGESSLDGVSQTLPMIYQMSASNFHDITTGSSTGSPSYFAATGYDLVTGRGTPNANRVVANLVNGGSPPTSPSPPPSPAPPSSPSPSSSPPPSSGGNLVGDGNFAQPNVGNNQVFNPTGSPWTFLGTSGIIGSGSFLTSGKPPVFDGLQSAFVFKQGSILQMLSLAPGSYTLSFQAAQANLIPGSQEQLQVLVGGMIVALVTPGPNFTINTTTFTIPSGGTYTLQFLGIASGNNSTALLDGVFLQGSASTSDPAPESSPSQSSSSGSASTLPSDPSPAQQSNPPPSSVPTPVQMAPVGSQEAQDDMESLLQAALSYWNNLLLSDWLLLQAEWQKFLHLVERWESLQ